MEATQTRTVTDSQRLQAIGLMTLARDLNNQLDGIEHALQEVLGETPPDDTWASDYVWSECRTGSSATVATDDLLRKGGWQIVPDPPADDLAHAFDGVGGSLNIVSPDDPDHPIQDVKP